MLRAADSSRLLDLIYDRKIANLFVALSDKKIYLSAGFLQVIAYK